MRILIADAFCSANRGDAAILDGILSGLARRLPAARFAVTTRFPALAARFHGVEALDDRDVVGVMRAIDRADLVVGCGGSYLHDLYALNLHPRLALIGACARAGRPYVAFAQSIGPLDSPLSRTAARNALSTAAWIAVRDEASLEVVRALGVSAPLHLGVDAAVGGRVTLQPRGTDGPLLGVTVRAWHFPGQPDAAAAQVRYEEAVVRAVAAWRARTGGRVRLLSNCTSLGGYAQDDRVPARRVAARLGPGTEVIEAEDLPFDVVRGQAAACDLLLGTRMHSLIFACTAGVPAVGIAYEAKTPGWLAQVGLPGLWRPIEAPEGLDALLLDAWERREDLRSVLAPRVEALRARAEGQLDTLAALARGERPAAGAPGRAVLRGDWDSETWKYARPHRRLRAVADAVLGEVAGGRTLDLGCSDGTLGRMLGPRFDYTGIDLAPSVACEAPGFRILTAALDEPWPLAGAEPFDLLLASGSLEYVADLAGVLARARAALRPGGLAVLTLFNLAHASRGPSAARHPTWRFEARPDEFVLLLREAGLAPARLFASSAGREPAPSVDAEAPTDLDRAGAAQLPLPVLLRLAHHVVAVGRAGEPRPGLGELGRLQRAGQILPALRLAVALAREAPWSARVWTELGILWSAAQDRGQARAALERARALDPARPGLAEAIAALG